MFSSGSSVVSGLFMSLTHFCMWYWVSEWFKVTHSYQTLCNPIDYTVHGILQARILEWVESPFSRGSSQPRDRTQVSRIAGGFFTSWAIILLPVAVQFSQHRFLKTVFSPLSILASLSLINWPKVYDSEFSILFHWSVCLLNKYHNVLITVAFVI